ncbi:hypothetical protein IQ244_08870 [Nostoc sp. LEGE 06077]|uniref:hypothetical protein n=1 Tax=Nostoc sp. LEGE 06077 TaxID=915325 RepID=UPI00187E8943|nr:hypothetical protein [Nostoc sp. LEGE 06077]MBE9206626.1 hypothetical protein [Nostoc sp. LEGE 06077]
MSNNIHYVLKKCIVLWHFLNQPLLSHKTFLNPFKFWQIYHLREKLEQSWNYDTIKLLERCCNYDTIIFLDRCLEIDNELMNIDEEYLIQNSEFKINE